MKIETKYNVGDRIWVVYEHQGEVCVYDDYVGWITYDKDLFYTTKESWADRKEDEIILYNDEEGLLAKIKELMQEIHEREKEK